ncbi:MAG: response regulator [Desulfobacteraceae bacterium]|nr:response regulator [Desulfobacteraceae bacterium]MCB9494201.1 response regulator [Desulfobacteraceae bacterium]
MKKLSCIIVDDEFHIRVFMKSVLKILGINVSGEAPNGEKGIEIFKELKPDLVFMDINMPVKTGDEALKEMKQLNPYSMIIMLTSVADMETVENCIKDGADFYIRKDTPVDELKSIISELVDTRFGIL